MYVRVNKGVESRGKVIPLRTFNAEIRDYIKQSPQSDWYRSLFLLGEEAKEHFDKHGSIRDYRGYAHSRDLIFDFDSKKDLDLAKEDVRTLLKRLKSEVFNIKDYVEVYFSGRKGFHVRVKTNTPFKPEELKQICKTLAHDLKTFDDVIYNTTRLFRISNTRHQETKLYKIQVDPYELKEKDFASRVLIRAKKAQPMKPAQRLENTSFLDKYRKPINNNSVVVDEEIEELEGIRGLNFVDFETCPKERPRCIHALLEGVMIPGEGKRHSIYLGLANYLYNQGFSREHVRSHLYTTARKNATYYPDSEPRSSKDIEAIVRMVCGSKVLKKKPKTGNWGTAPDNEIFKNYCRALDGITDIPCTMHNSGKKSESVVQIVDVAESFSNYAENIDKNLTPTGINFIDDHMQIAVGTMTILAGASGSGKTTCILNMLENNNKLGLHSIFFSIDMGGNFVYQKLAQKCTGFTKEEIFKFNKQKNLSKIKEIKQKISQKYGKTFFDFTGSVSTEDIKERILETEKEKGVKIKLVVIDYASQLVSQHSDSYTNAKHNALSLKNVADETDTAMIVLSQISRATGDGSTPLRTKRVAKDSGDWEEAAQNVITVWRPFMGLDGQPTPEGEVFKDNIMKIFLAKNRMGQELEAPLFWDGATSMVRDLTDEELEIYHSEIKPMERMVDKAKAKS